MRKTFSVVRTFPSSSFSEIVTKFRLQLQQLKVSSPILRNKQRTS